MDTNLTASDVALLNGRNDDWGNSSFMWIFALLILANGGLWGNNGYQPQYATQDFVQNGFNFNDLQDQNRDIMNSITNGTAQSVAATNQAKYDNINVAKDIQSALSAQIGDVKMLQQQVFANQTECCCNTLRAIDGVNYNQALNTAAINANVTAQTQKDSTTVSSDSITWSTISFSFRTQYLVLLDTLMQAPITLGPIRSVIAARLAAAKAT